MIFFLVSVTIPMFLPLTNAGTATFGNTNAGTSIYELTAIYGSEFSSSVNGQVDSITTYLSYSAATRARGYTTPVGGFHNLKDRICASEFSFDHRVYVQNIKAYITSTGSSDKAKAAIYTLSGTLVAATNEITLSSGVDWRTFPFASAQPLDAGTYILAVWGNSATSTINCAYGQGRYADVPYGEWGTVSFSTTTDVYIIYCTTTDVAPRVKCAIYSSNGVSRLGISEEKYLLATSTWYSFKFATKPTVSTPNSYVLAAWSSISSFDNSVLRPRIYYQSSGATKLFVGGGSYSDWPTSIQSYSSSNLLSIYATVLTVDATALTLDVEPKTVDKNAESSATISGYLTSSGAGLEGYAVRLGYNTGSGWLDVGSGTITTGNDGYYEISFPVTPTMQNGYVAFTASFAGTKDYSACGPIYTGVVGEQQGNLHVVPEYALCGLLALAACFAAFIMVKKRSAFS
jgi:hypothetical protein